MELKRGKKIFCMAKKVIYSCLVGEFLITKKENSYGIKSGSAKGKAA